MDGASGTAGFMFDYLFQIGYTRLFSFVESMMIRFVPSERSGWGPCPWYPKHNNELNETYVYLFRSVCLTSVWSVVVAIPIPWVSVL